EFVALMPLPPFPIRPFGPLQDPRCGASLQMHDNVVNKYFNRPASCCNAPRMGRGHVGENASVLRISAPDLAPE
ncbi:MAG TPA: hypothetical protein VFN69_03420, partial [Rudaea sp.]|nr:hypothetical protein [Rudaea sp.]